MVDTSREAVARIAASFEIADCDSSCAGQECECRQTAALIRALLSRAEKAEAERDALLEGHTNQPKRHYYEKASKALNEAHLACFRHPERPLLGMSHGPFSGVNEALGIIATLDQLRLDLQAKAMSFCIERDQARAELASLKQEAMEAMERVMPIVEKWCHTQGDNLEFHNQTMRPLRAFTEKWGK